jgi:hypothetical protein
LSRLPGSPNAEVTNKEKETKGKKQAQQGEVDEVVEREEEEQLHHAQQDKQLRGSNVTHLFFLLLLHILTYREIV